MEIIVNPEIAKKIQNACNNINKRLWICSPFIGRLNSIEKILGSIMLKTNIDIKLITDSRNKLDNDSLIFFKRIGKIREIKGVHAKIYIFYNVSIISSANLTNSAFTKRQEIGIYLDKNETKNILELYEKWWKESVEFDFNIPLSKSSKSHKTSNTENRDNDLPNRWQIPESDDYNFRNLQYFRDYYVFLSRYNDFVEKYQSTKRLWNIPIYLETDCFLDYLFHHDKKPSYKYILSKPRNLTENKKIIEIQKYKEYFKKYIKSLGHDEQKKRLNIRNHINNYLSVNEINNLTHDRIEEIIGYFNSMHRFAINRKRFLNEKNNSLFEITKNWNNLLHGNDNLLIRMQNCYKNLKYFGPSSIYELIAWVFPEKFPIRNRNISSGLRFFGYDVIIYG